MRKATTHLNVTAALKHRPTIVQPVCKPLLSILEDR
jgi:hypothetical protein